MVSTYVLQWVDALCALLDLTANHLWDELGGKLAECAALCLPRHDIRHLLPDLPNLRRCCICCLLDLVRPPLGERNAEESEKVVIGRLHHNIGLNQRLPLADERSEFVGGEVEAVEVGQTVLALDLVDS